MSAEFKKPLYYLDPNTAIAVLISGGVDSSVALYRLFEAGYHNLHPFYLKIWLQDDQSFLGNCPWKEDLNHATAVCKRLGLDLQIEPLQEEYYELVVSYMLKELRLGATPSPDLMCNSHIKFGAFFERLENDFTYIASGHYAQIFQRESGISELHRAPDPVKDQSYFLSHLHQNQLKRLIFPLAGLWKKEVRQLAQDWQLENAQRADSQGLCFLGKISYRDFIAHHLGEQKGEIREVESEKILGEHHGYWFYTIGQRQGLGLSGGPWYVTAKNCQENIVYVQHSQFLEELQQSFYVEEPNWISQEGEPGNYLLKLRHGPDLIECSLNKDQRGWKIHLQRGDRGIASGQFAVIYQKSQCLASARIL